jgi:hypothetical protein
MSHLIEWSFLEDRIIELFEYSIHDIVQRQAGEIAEAARLAT